jgi:CRISP-associated protein Cas1
MVDERDTTYSHMALVKLAEHGGALVVCGRDHMPCGIYAAISGNTALLERLDAQLRMSKPTGKRLWAQIVTAKIRAQAGCLDHAPAARAHLWNLSREVRSGDPENLEGQAARVYWGALFAGVQSGFRRVPGDLSADPPNNLLDYGYAVLRAALARALVSAGLLPALGIKHISRGNYFCLADDLIEPIRPVIDRRARALATAGRLSLDQPTKAELLLTLTATVELEGEQGPLEVAIPRYVASFVRCITGEAARLEVPRILPNETPPAASDDEDPP